MLVPLLLDASLLLSFQETQNLKSRVQKQQVFEEELADNEKLLHSLEQTGQEMIETGHYASPQVAARVEEVLGLWKELLEATAQRGQHKVAMWGCVVMEGTWKAFNCSERYFVRMSLEILPMLVRENCPLWWKQFYNPPYNIPQQTQATQM